MQIKSVKILNYFYFKIITFFLVRIKYYVYICLIKLKLIYDMEKSGNTIMREMFHTMEFLKSMGFNTENLSVAEMMDIKSQLLKIITKELGEPTNEVKNPF